MKRALMLVRVALPAEREPAFSTPGEDERDAAPVATAARALRDLGYDQNTIAVLFLQGAALFAEGWGPEEFARLARRSWNTTERRVAEIRAEGQVLS